MPSRVGPVVELIMVGTATCATAVGSERITAAGAVQRIAASEAADHIDTNHCGTRLERRAVHISITLAAPNYVHPAPARAAVTVA
jgi:hypothetical protein